MREAVSINCTNIVTRVACLPTLHQLMKLNERYFDAHVGAVPFKSWSAHLSVEEAGEVMNRITQAM
jgi:hypothetical protein